MGKPLSPQERAEWQKELEDQWHTENQHDPLDVMPHDLRMSVQAAREYTMRTLEGAMVYLDLLSPSPRHAWISEKQYHRTPEYVIKPGEVVYHTYEGWYDHPPTV